MTTKKTTTTTQEAATTKAPVVSEYKVAVARAESIGHTLSATEKLDAANACMKSTKSEHVRELLSVYIGDYQKALAGKELKAIHADTGNASDTYKVKLYAAAADYADCIEAHDAAGTKAAERVLGFDGVVSCAKAREIAKANSEKREAAVAEVFIEKKAG